MSIYFLFFLVIVMVITLLILTYNLYNADNERNIILTYCKGYSISKIRAFLITLHKVSPNSFLLLFSDNATIVDSKKILNDKVIGIELLDNYPYYKHDDLLFPISYNELITFIPTFVKGNDRTFHIIIRFYLINEWIKKYGFLYKSILVCDIKDIIFQKDPFSFYEKDGVYIQQEVYYRNNKGGFLADNYNLRWINQYHPSHDILIKPILNNGQIIGSSNEMKLFINDYCNFMNRTVNITNDQGVFNYFVYTNTFNYNVYLKEHGYGYALLLHYPIPFTKDNFTPNGYYIYNFDGSIPPIIHSYIHGLWHGSENRKKMYKRYIDYHTNFY